MPAAVVVDVVVVVAAVVVVVLVVVVDEHETLVCLQLCTRTEEGAARLIDHPSGLFTTAVCVMSNFRYSFIRLNQFLSHK